jgi:hypothetical protein
MTRRTAAIEEAISTVNLATTRAAAAALRKTHALAHGVPVGRAFTAIATLCELTERVEDHLMSGHKALVAGDEATAIPEFQRARALAGGTIIEAQPDPAMRVPAPRYLVKRR